METPFLWTPIALPTVEFSKQKPCHPQVPSAAFILCGSKGGTFHAWLFPSLPCELSVSHCLEAKGQDCRALER